MPQRIRQTNLDAVATELHAKMLTLAVGEWCWGPNVLLRIRRISEDTFEYTRGGLKTSGSATGIASMVTLLTQGGRAPGSPASKPVKEDAVSRKRIVDYCESLKDGALEKKRKTNVDYAMIGVAQTIAEFVQTLLPLEN